MLANKKFVIGLLGKIGLCSEASAEVLRLADIWKTNPSVFDFLDGDFPDDGTFYNCIVEAAEKLGEKKEVVAMCAAFVMSEPLLEKYRKRNIPDEYFYNIAADFKIWADNCKQSKGFYGIDVIHWITRHLSENLYRVGRLQFERINFEFDDVTCDNGKVIKKGDRLLYIHVPQGEPLDYDECAASRVAAVEFLKKYYNESFEGFFCQSWLLHPNLKDILPENANIVRFQGDFNVFKTDEDAAQAIERVLKCTFETLGTAVQETSLQKNMMRYIKDGGKLGQGWGVIPIGL